MAKIWVLSIVKEPKTIKNAFLIVFGSIPTMKTEVFVFFRKIFSSIFWSYHNGQHWWLYACQKWSKYRFSVDFSALKPYNSDSSWNFGPETIFKLKTIALNRPWIFPRKSSLKLPSVYTSLCYVVIWLIWLTPASYCLIWFLSYLPHWKFYL